MQSQNYLLVVLGAITVACGFYYYLKVVRAMYWQAAPENAPVLTIPALSRVAMIFLGLGIVVFGIYPRPILALLQ